MIPNPEQLAAEYTERGYLVCDRALPANRVAELRNRMQAIADGQVPDFPAADIELEPGSRAVRKINRCAENDPLFRSHAADPAILEIVAALIGPDIKLFGSQCFMKPPGGVAKPWHQDSAYFPIEPMALVTCWTALDEVTVDNGGMWAIPGSHQGGLVEHAKWRLGDRDDKQIPEERLHLEREEAIELPAGGCSFHHSLLLHRSGPNRSDQPRRGLAVHYMSATSRWTAQDTPKPEYPLLTGSEHPGCV